MEEEEEEEEEEEQASNTPRVERGGEKGISTGCPEKKYSQNKFVKLSTIPECFLGRQHWSNFNFREHPVLL